MKRPALRGDVTRAGVTCDARLLSCSFFEPSVLPLLWAFYRSRMRQNETLSGAESVTGRLANLPASRYFFRVAHEVARGKTVPCDNGPHRPRHCVSASRRYTDATQSTGWVQTALQRETGAFTVLGRGSHWDRQLLAEMILPKKQRLLLRLSTPSRIVVRWTKSLSLITA